MPRSQDSWSRDLVILSILQYNSNTLYQISTSFLEEKSLMHFIKPLPIKQNV